MLSVHAVKNDKENALLKILIYEYLLNQQHCTELTRLVIGYKKYLKSNTWDAS